jgi:hypothetical protein
VRFSGALLLRAVRCSCARKNCVLADCRFTVAVGSADELEAAVLGAKPTPHAANSATAKTGETRAKLLCKKKLLRSTATLGCAPNLTAPGLQP